MAAALFVTVIAAVPAAEQVGIRPATWVRLALTPTCHQIADRCLDLGHGPLPLCARCSGLWVGGMLGLAVCFVTGRCARPSLLWLAAAAAPSVVDFVFGFLGGPTLANWPRFTLAAVLGIVLGFFVSDALADVVSGRARDDVK
jgi:uncharacterized membrane protein